MKKLIVILIALFNMNVLVAQQTPSTTKPSGSTPSTSTPSNTRQQDSKLEQHQQSQTPTGRTNVPGNVNQQFGKDYPNVSSQWEMQGSDYRAVYNDDKTQQGRAVIYNSTGQVVGMENEVGAGEYPSSIDNHLSTAYPNEPLKVWTKVDEKGGQTYFVARQNGRIWFDQTGNPSKVKSSVK